MGKWTEKWSDSDDSKDSWGRSNDSRADEFTSNKGDGENHCHLWVNKESGESGVEHRGYCNVCDDEKRAETDNQGNGNDSGGSGK